MQGWITAQRRYCAGPRLAQARDASLEHHESRRDTERQQAAVLGTARKWGENHYDEKCLKTISKVKYQDRNKIFFWNFRKLHETTPKSVQMPKIFTIMAYSSKRSQKPKNSIGRKKIRRSSQTFFFLSPLSCWPELSGTRIKIPLGSDLQWWKAKVGKRQSVWRWW
jgi:hypothetical protein